MLRDIKNEEFDLYVNYAYSLAMKPCYASYPIFYDGLKTKQDFINSALKFSEMQYAKIKLFEVDNKVRGWINYYWDTEDNSIRVYTFLVEDRIEQALEEYIHLIETDFPGYSICFGFPKENTNAINYLKDHSFVIDEIGNNTVYVFDNYIDKPITLKIIEIEENNFDLFRNIHDNSTSNMYWTSDRMLAHLNKWMILLIKDKGAIYYLHQGILSEIFGIDVIDNDKDTIRCELIKSALNKMNQQNVRNACFITEDEELKSALDSGFKFIGKYYYFVKEY